VVDNGKPTFLTKSYGTDMVILLYPSHD